MMRRAAFIILLLNSPVFATDKLAGTSGAEFLKIGAGARASAMGDAFVGLADDINAVYYNPSGLGFISRPEIVAMHTEWIEQINYDYGAFAYPTDAGAFAISATTLRVDSIEKRGLDEGALGSFDSLDSAYTFSYAHTVGPLTSLGVTARYIKQEIDAYSASAWGGDVGIMRRHGRLPLSFGLAVRNFGQEIKFREKSDPQPMVIDGGMGASLFRDRLRLALNAYKPRDNGVQFGLGTEYLKELGKDYEFSLRAGYNTVRTDAEGASGLSLGAGLGFNRFDFDFAWVPFGDLGNTFRYSLHVKF